jgi:hypothetical protein
LSFLSAWTNKLHDLGYVSGVYSSASSGIRLLDDAQTNRPGRYTMPDRVWIADWNGRDDVYSEYVRPESWMPHSRVHQYRGGHDETHGGVRINIDSNYLSLGRGSVAPPEGRHCGVQVSFGRYRRLVLGREGDQVRALQCMLRHRKLYDGRLSGVFNERTEAAVKRFEAARGLRVTGRMSRQRWGVILSQGATRVVKIGSASQAVRRVQRTLNALGEGGVPVTGLFDETTTEAVRTYQRAVGLPATGVVAADTWEVLRSGQRATS